MSYEAMCRAIAECQRVDEVKEIHDKALALELYARQALNQDAENTAKEIRLRVAADNITVISSPVHEDHESCNAGQSARGHRN